VPPTLTANRFPGILENTKAFLAVMALHTKGLYVMNGTNLVFDTCAVVKLLDRQYDLPSLGINIDEARLLTSVIVRMELLSKRNMTDGEELDIWGFLNDLIVVPLDEAIEQKAIEIRRATFVKLPDCIVAATSIILNAILLTDDKHLLDLSWPGLNTQNIF
jgi:predicted nucleic acid-binding protein